MQSTKLIMIDLPGGHVFRWGKQGVKIEASNCSSVVAWDSTSTGNSDFFDFYRPNKFTGPLSHMHLALSLDLNEKQGPELNFAGLQG